MADAMPQDLSVKKLAGTEGIAPSNMAHRLNPMIPNWLAGKLSSLAKRKRFLTNSSWEFAGKMLEKVLTFTLMWLLVKYLPADRYGQYVFLLSCVQFLSISGLSGAGETILQSAARGFDGTYFSTTKFGLKLSLIGTLLLILIGSFQLHSGNPELALSLVVCSLLFPFAYALDKWEFFFKAKQNFGIVTLAKTTMLVAQTAIIAALAYYGHLTLFWCSVVTVATIAGLSLVMSYRVYRKANHDAPVEPKSMQYALHVTGWAIPDQIGNQLDKWILFFAMSPEILAVYYVAEKLPELLKKNVQALSAVFIPTMSTKAQYTDDLDRKLNWIAIAYILIFLVPTAAIIPWLLPFVFPGYSDSVLYCEILLASIAIGAFPTIKFGYIRAKFDLQGYRNVVLWMSLARIAFAIALVPFLGPLGAALSSLFYRIVTFTLVHSNLERHRDPSAIAK